MGHVRRATTGDIPTIRELRLAALTDSPEAFGSTLEREVARPPEDWLRWLSPGAVFLLAVDGTPGGLVAVAPDDGGAPFAWLLAMWVAPAFRQGGNGGRLVSAALDHAAAEWPDLPEVRLEVAAGNGAAVALYARHGFVLSDEVPPDRYHRCDKAMVRPNVARTGRVAEEA